jgi:hypothetical protein
LDSSLPKEEYDKLNYKVADVDYHPCTILFNIDDGAFGDGMAYVLESYITMYETTGDKAYLYKFIFESLCIMENRHDYAIHPIFPPRWEDLGDNVESTYRDGNIVAGLARFVYFIKNNPDLYNMPLHPFNEIVNNSFEENFFFKKLVMS